MGTKVFFFAGDKYVRYDRGEDRVDDGYPLPIAQTWGGMQAAGFGRDIDAAVNWGDGNVYFFKGDRYLRYSIAKDKVDDGYPLPIAQTWSGMQAAGFDRDIDAAVNWGDGNVYFFKGDKYLRYSIAKDKVDDGYPLPITQTWSGMQAASFGSNLKAAIPWGDGKVFFFNRGNQYIRYDIANDKVDSGYPLIIADQWPGMAAAGFAIGIGTAVDLLDLTKEIWVPGATMHRKTPVGPRFRNMPWRGVLHTTEGSTLSGAEATLDAARDWPHLTIEPKTSAVVQQIPLNIGCRALGDANGTLATNSANAIQIEIVGMAKDSATIPVADMVFIRNVMRQIEDLVPIPRKSGRAFLGNAAVNTTPGNRMSVKEWSIFSGWCGHQHVPGQDHWDPGAINISELLKT